MLLMQGKKWPAYNLCSDKAGFITGENICIDGGMTRQMNALSTLGLLSRFVGLLTDSRSFISYPRHEYFRRLLCNLLGNDVENGLLPDDRESLYRMVEDISYNNAKNYFNF